MNMGQHRVFSDQSYCSQPSTASDLLFQDDDHDNFNDGDDSDVFHEFFQSESCPRPRNRYCKQLSRCESVCQSYYHDDDLDNINDDDSDVFHDFFETPILTNSTKEEVKSSIFLDIAQAELVLWTFAFSLLFTKLWSTRRKSLLINIFIVTPTAIWVTAVLSGLLLIFAVFGWIFGSEEIDSKNLNLRSATSELPSHKSSLESVGGLRSCGSYGEQLSLLTCRRHSSVSSNRPPLSRKLSMWSTKRGAKSTW